MGSRLRYQYCKVIIATSMVWFLLDVVLLMYYTDCASNPSCDQNREVAPGGVAGNPPKKSAGLLDAILPKGIFKPAPPNLPGEMGKAVVIPPDLQAKSKEMFKINQFNLMASEMIRLNRTLPDVRMESCKHKEYVATNLLPDTSVVIVFHNEAWTTLLRTVWSIIQRSPHELIKEIILVDDASERDFLGRKLEMYVKELPVPVVIERMGERKGLIRARLRGASVAKGQVITFLDAHCECTEGWLEPLLYEIYKDRTSVVCPIIDVISDETFEYITGSDMTWGGFNWKLNFRWYPVPQREMERRGGDRSLPLRSPTMAGGLLSIERNYFYEIGSYDRGMDIWGGENLEMSFRVWMCGGQVLIATCSRVGHVFRKVSPYSWPGGVVNILNHNTMRTVEVWMDNYKDFYYKINPGVKQTEVGDLTQRLDLRKKLECKSFRWYLENIYPESQMPLDYYSLGEVRNKETNMCLDSMGRKSGEKVGMVPCHNMGGNQVFSYTKKKSLMTDDLCIDVSQVKGPVKFFKCHGLGGNQLFEYDKQTLQLKHSNSNQCLDKPNPSERDTPSVGPCNNKPSQQWVLGDIDLARM
ncbi:unnamed protein product [Owenia fusiformis]|uniref:Polypeptide N-acetylgalactosaminyltransferase n=1 Tax=Owenia fusiformis TaxID=6347 RepID=A0A8J1YB44_OWEFU|nr:unnamed protein product [Owenia fusiformis]